MSRSLKKHVFFPIFFFKKKFNDQLKDGRLKIFSRSVRLVNQLVGSNLWVYNGRKFFELKITSNTLNQKFGEFSVTRIPFVHKRKKKKKNLRKKKQQVKKK